MLYHKHFKSLYHYATKNAVKLIFKINLKIWMIVYVI